MRRFHVCRDCLKLRFEALRESRPRVPVRLLMESRPRPVHALAQMLKSGQEASRW
jgi:hypothetical protein